MSVWVPKKHTLKQTLRRNCNGKQDGSYHVDLGPYRTINIARVRMMKEFKLESLLDKRSGNCVELFSEDVSPRDSTSGGQGKLEQERTKR